jgi:hypothetical protein
MTPLPFHPSPLFMSFNVSSLLQQPIRATRAMAAPCNGAVSRGRASRAYKPRGNAPPT